MIGRILNRIRYLWIVIILSVLLLAAAVALLVHSVKPRERIPQKGVFVLAEANTVKE
ncbi:MAG: hypothetical protein GXZ01_04690 [Clostridiaceae bacterium]|jgi:hypothetical protein|nr:hypothetical protein [Clostridiaceae bacterium]